MVKNIRYNIEEAAVKFNYDDEKDIKQTAYLQLPKTGDSQDIIDSVESENWTDEQKEIYEQLVEYFKNQFNDIECYAASCLLCKTIIKVVDVTYENRSLSVAFDEDDEATIIVDSAYKDYYNKRALYAAFDEYEYFGDEEIKHRQDIIVEGIKKRQETEAIRMLQSIEVIIRINISNTGNYTAKNFIDEMNYEFKSLTSGVDIIDAEIVDYEILE